MQASGTLVDDMVRRLPQALLQILQVRRGTRNAHMALWRLGLCHWPPRRLGPKGRRISLQDALEDLPAPRILVSFTHTPLGKAVCERSQAWEISLLKQRIVELETQLDLTRFD